MNKKEIQAKVRELLLAKTPKATVFRQLSGQGVKDSQLAYFIASYADPQRCKRYQSQVNILIGIMFVLALIGFFVGFGIGAKISPNAQWITGALIALITLLFAWGFYANRVGAYNAYIMLSLIQLPKSLEGFTSDPIPTTIAFAINIALLAYVLYVQKKIFPDFAFITPKKVKGEYVFTD